MPTAHKRSGTDRTKNGKNWVIKVRLAGFPQKTRSFYTRAEGMRWGYDLEDAYRAGIDPATADPLDQANKPAPPSTEPSPSQARSQRPSGERTVRAALELYAPRAERKLSEATWRNKERPIITYWMAHPFADMKVEDLFPDDVDMWIADSQDDGVASGTLKNRRNTLNQTIEMALNHWRMNLRNPAAGRRIKDDPPSRRRPTRAEKRRLYEAALSSDSDLIYWAMRWAEECGMRRAEITRLKVGDIDFTEQSPVLTIPVAKTQPRSFYMWPELIDLYKQIRTAVGHGAYLFGGIRADSITQAFGRIRAAADVSSEVVFHSFRYEANSWMAEAGVDKKLRKIIVGHVSDEMSEHYTHFSEVAADIMSRASRMGHRDTPPHSTSEHHR